MRTQNSNSPKRGATLLAVITILTVLGLIFASFISWAILERRMNLRHEDRLESKATAESLIEYGFAQLQHKFSHYTSLPSDAITATGDHTINLPNSNIFDARVISSSLELTGGDISSLTTTAVYIDPTDPVNLNDPMKGKRVFTQEVTLYAKASVMPTTGSTSITSYLSQRLQIRDSPLFSHAIFYNLDLDIHPGPTMNIYGPVHTNGNLRVDPGNSGLNFYDQVTTSKDFLHSYYHTAARHSGNVTFQNAANEAVSIINTTEALDSILGDDNVANMVLDSSMGESFRPVASTLWDGNLLTSLDNVSTYQPVYFKDYEPDNPDTEEYDPVNTSHDLIEPPIASNSDDYVEAVEEQKMANKAGLYLKWDTTTNTLEAERSNGGNLNISQLEETLWTYTEDAFYDHRRNQSIDIMDINVGVLKMLIENPGNPADEKIPSYSPEDDWNGVVYLECYSSDEDTKDVLNYSGIRLSGGATGTTAEAAGEGIPSLGTDIGMTFATNNALYVKGNFNADGVIESDSATEPDDSDEVPVSLMADTVTFLSSDWDDTITDPKPTAISTEISAAVISGLTPSYTTRNGVTSYQNGGVHNFPRFLEAWSGRTFAIRGSLVCLYEAEVDWSIFDDSGSYYSAPNREYGYNSLFENGVFPPGTPMIRDYKRLAFDKLTKAEYDAAVD